MPEHVSVSLPARILIVDDHPNTATMLARVLGRFETPVEVLTACSGEEALEIVNTRPVDILITDFIMSGINGLDLVDKLKGELEPAHKILITAYDTPGLAVSARSLRIQDYLIKPVQPEKIREIVGKALKDLRINQPEPSQRNFKILIADDHPDNIRLLAIRLKSEGYEYIFAEDGEDTLAQIHSEKPDLVLLDVNMPRKDGFQVLTEARNDPEISHIPIIIVTAARLTSKDVREGLTLGADDYITKPIDWRELSARIRNKLRVKEAEDNLRKRNRELEVLPEISQDLGDRLDVETLTRAILGRTVAALGATDGYLIVFHPDGNITYQSHCLDITPGFSDEEYKNRFISSRLVTQVVQDRQAVFIEDAQGDDRWAGPLNEKTRSVIAVPIIGRHGVLAVLVLTHERQGFFQPDLQALLQAISSQASIAIENVQLYTVERKRVNELVTLNQLTREINRFTRAAELFEQLPRLLCHKLGFPASALWIVEEGKLTLKSLFGAENTTAKTLLEIGSQQALETQQPVLFSRPIHEDARHDAMEGAKAQSVVAVPMFRGDQVTGVLSIHNNQDNRFQESHRVLLEMLTAHIANALERIRLFETAERGQKRLTAVLNSVGDAILVMDTEERLELTNPAGQRLFTDVDARVGQRLPVQQGYDTLLELLETARSSGVPKKGEVVWPDERTFSVLVSPIVEGGQVALLHDVSHFKALDQIKNEFIATASHDLKNPIFAVLGYNDLLNKAGPLNEMQIDFTRRIRRAAIQMRDLVLNLLDMAWMDMGIKLDMEILDINELMKSICDEFSSRVEEKDQGLNFKFSDRPIKVWGDRMRLEQVARNLIGNAMKYTPDGGQITVVTQPSNGKVAIKVYDTGIGIPEEALPNLFSKFYRVRTKETEDIEGNGLGLAIVKAIIEKHGGQVAVESMVGKGSCFTFTLNIKEKAPKREKQPVRNK